ncbi:uncharacterized protein LOC131314204 [Rhododendron vialii]|uniref:uncharacterized protein LOC131314204 n=1 Tax=Rhododendron vialii TaxID=182163 RepID=UPI00265FFEAA|nr:uncharacterized protein LOC131314204 [Rhododendron vialii]
MILSTIRLCGTVRKLLTSVGISRIFLFPLSLRLPRSLCQYFRADGSGTWVILRHGLKAWSVQVVNQEFRNGWDDFREAHGLKADHKIVFGCERKWVFHTIMFDADGRELVFDWSGPNGHWQDLPPLAGGVRTACLPSTLTPHNAVVKFVYFNVYGPELRTGIETRLRYVFRMLALEQMVVKMADRTWIIPIQDLRLNVDAFNQLAASLHVQCLNHIMFVMLPTIEFRVIVFDGRYDSERIYDWF